MNTATIKNFEDKSITVKIGDWVGFKSDYEQTGQIVKIERNQWSGQIELTLEDKNGFGGEYLRYATTTTVYASDCWVS